jgi:hypothetical protein
VSQAAAISNHPHIFHGAWTTVPVTWFFPEASPSYPAASSSVRYRVTIGATIADNKSALLRSRSRCGNRSPP